MAFSPWTAAALRWPAVTANGGQLTTNLYVLALAQGDPVQLGTATSVPQWLGWLSGDSVLAFMRTGRCVRCQRRREGQL